jgi:hypothetical protein
MWEGRDVGIQNQVWKGQSENVAFLEFSHLFT